MDAPGPVPAEAAPTSKARGDVDGRGADDQPVEFTLNGLPAAARVGPGMSMLELLREACGVTSVKDGCAPEGSCGACTVLLNGRACVSCAQPATRVAGRAVVTQEGLPPQARTCGRGASWRPAPRSVASARRAS